jgi:hypothetical protein
MKGVTSYKYKEIAITDYIMMQYLEFPVLDGVRTVRIWVPPVSEALHSLPNAG